MTKLVITGDTHGEYGRLLEIHNLMQKYEDEEKYICVAGDFGYLFHDSFSEHRLLNEIEQQAYNFIVVPGNHENYARFKEYEIVDFFGAKAHRVRKNIFYICRGEIFSLGGKSFFCMSGGYSIDKFMRRENISWWKDEMPTDQEYKNATKNIERHRQQGGRIDYIISHTAPLSALCYLGKNHGAEEAPLNNYLEYVKETLEDEYVMHFFGHLHIDRELPTLRQRALMFDYVEIPLES